MTTLTFNSYLVACAVTTIIVYVIIIIGVDVLGFAGWQAGLVATVTGFVTRFLIMKKAGKCLFKGDDEK